MCVYVCKKQQLNKQLLHLHLNLATSWNNSWPYIQNTIEEKLNMIIKLKYKYFDIKFKKLMQEQIKTPHKCVSFYPRVINNNDITFSNKELVFYGIAIYIHPPRFSLKMALKGRNM